MSDTEEIPSADTLYAKPHVYFLVPYNVDVEAEEDELGAMFRLGEYSDVEETARADGFIDEYYPEQHIEDAEAAGKTSTAIAAGEKDFAKGILLACDGRILLKSRGKMYSDTADYHRRTRGTYKLVIDDTYTVTVSGDVSITSTTGDINVKASAGDIAVQSGTNKDIIFRAGTDSDSGATGKIYEYSKGHVKKIDGQSYTVAEEENTYTTGTSNNFFFGATSTIKASAEFALTMGAAAEVKPMISLGLSGVEISYAASSVDLKDVYCKIRGIQTESQALKSEINALKSDIATIASETQSVKASTQAVQSDTRSIKTTVGNLQADVQNLIFYT